MKIVPNTRFCNQATYSAVMADKRLEPPQDTLQRAADQHATTVLPVIREIQRAGATSLRDIADALNARGMTTAGGRAWFATSVSKVLARARRLRS